MGEILGVGTTHWPGLNFPDESKSWPLMRSLSSDHRVPEEMKNPTNWPEAMRIEFGEDEGVTSHKEHRRRLAEAFRKVRDEIDAFNPDFILMFGDDQYENFKEDLIPAFCLLAYDEFECRPWAQPRYKGKPNFWGEPEDHVISVEGRPHIARRLAKDLIEEGFDMAYGYKPLHAGPEVLGHAFLNTWMFLDYDRKGIDYPLIPLAVNCYGSSVIRNRGGMDVDPNLSVDPPSPTPKRCFELGQAIARVLKRMPERAVIMGSSSWSHGFLTERNHFLWPDHEADRAAFEQLRDNRQVEWKNMSLTQIEEAGQQELLNWVCLAGAMHELGQKTEVIDYIETWVFNSEKCMAVFKP